MEDKVCKLNKLKEENSEEEESFSPIVKKWLIKISAEPIKNFYSFQADKNIVGEGRFGYVVKATHKITEKRRAIKIIPKKKIKNAERFRTEVEAMRTFDHPNIIKLFEVYEDKDNIYMVMELCDGGELFEKITEEGCIEEQSAKQIFIQILSAINYTHARNVCHRDLKPENFLFLHKNQTPPVIKLIDFGLSKILGNIEIMNFESLENRAVEMQTKTGTPYYIAPEVLEGKYTQSCDLWSAGVILFIMLCGYPPFYGETDKEILVSVLKGKYEFTGEIWDGISEEAKDVISKILKKECERIKGTDLLSHPWFRDITLKRDELIEFEKLRDFTKYTNLKKSILSIIASQLSEDDIQNLKDCYLSLDSSGFGVVSLDDFTDYFSSHRPELDPREIEQVFKLLNTDNTGILHYNEFIAASLSEKITRDEKLIKCAFKLFDRENKGKIEIKDLKNVFQNQHSFYRKMNDEYWRKILEQADLNKDGIFDFEDFLNLLQT